MPFVRVESSVTSIARSLFILPNEPTSCEAKVSTPKRQDDAHGFNSAILSFNVSASGTSMSRAQ